MEISQLGLLASGTSETSRAEQGAIGLADNFDNFLNLLTEQLQNQDPLEPLKSTEFTNQLVQFAGVEQAVNQNRSLEKMLEIQQANQAVAATGFLGTKVEVFGDQLDFKGQEMPFTYRLADDSAETLINIRDANGRIVRTLQGETGPGSHDMAWDGKNTQGLQVEDGLYQIEVVARDAAGESVDTATTVTGTVSGVAAQDGTVMLRIGEASFPVDKVVSVTGQGTGDQDSTTSL